MRFIKPFLSIVFLISFFSACKYNGAATAPNNNDGGSDTTGLHRIFPLNVGNRWVYSVTGYDNTGVMRSLSVDTLVIAGTTNYQGMAAYKLAEGAADTLLDYYLDSNLYTVSYGTASIVLHYPMTAGQTFVIQDTISNGYINKEVLVMQSANESVTVPAGTFSAMHFDDIVIEGLASTPDTQSIKKAYYISGIGKVKQELFLLYQNLGLYLADVIELKSYTIK